VSDAKQCGHQDGKVTVPHEDFVSKINAVRYAFLELGVENGVIIARTDSLGASLTQKIPVTKTKGDLASRRVCLLFTFRKLLFGMFRLLYHTTFYYLRNIDVYKITQPLNGTLFIGTTAFWMSPLSTTWTRLPTVPPSSR
jgi:isocitrate lyase